MHLIFFLHFYPKVQEGSIVTVPERPESIQLSSMVVQATSTIVPLLITYIIFKIK